LIGAVYALFGIAILAMCFDLMQEEIIAKFTWLGKKIGIIEKDDEEKAEDERKKQERREKEGGGASGNHTASPTAHTSSNSSKRNSVHVGDRDRFGNNSPAPSYSAANISEEERAARIRDAYFKNLKK
jgi:hypothetical protein